VRVLFVYPDICTGSGRFQQGIASLSAVLKREGHETALLHLTGEPRREEFLRAVTGFRPGLVGFSATTNQFPYVRRFAAWVKEATDVPVVCGGMHPTLAPEDAAADANLDVICRGEGEEALLELVQALETGGDITGIENLWVRHNGELYRNPVRPLLEDLDTLPFPDREIFHFDTLLTKFWHTADFMTGRGCPYDCTYCCNHSLRELYHDLGKYVRRRTVPNVMAEIGQVTQRYRVEQLNFDDDTFTLDRTWLAEFSRAYSEQVGLPFTCNARPETLTPEVIASLKTAGCEMVQVGIESGSEALREAVLKRRFSNEDLVAAFANVREAGIATYAFNMVGLPSETPAMARETLEMNRRVAPDDLQVSIFYPYPGTELFETCRANDWLAPNAKSSYFDEGVALRQPSMTAAETMRAYRALNRLSLEKKVRNRSGAAFAVYRGVKAVLGEGIAYRLLTAARGAYLLAHALGTRLAGGGR
jgi:anaerobic magnesium-protoporphyrin IX monomethyl ester cyclase